MAALVAPCDFSRHIPRHRCSSPSAVPLFVTRRMLLHETWCLSSRQRLVSATDSPLRGRCSAPHRRTLSRTAAPVRAAWGFFDGLFGGAKKPPPPGKRPGVVAGNCVVCANKGAITCMGCRGSGRNKANGNPLERYKCFNCQVRADDARAAYPSADSAATAPGLWPRPVQVLRPRRQGADAGTDGREVTRASQSQVATQ